MSEREVTGLREASAKLAELGAELGAKTLRQALSYAATPIVQDARLRIPVGDKAHRSYKGNLLTPGFAKRSIKRMSKIIDARAVVFIGVKREAYYATQFVEVGTDKMDAQPWLVPALEAKRDTAEARLVSRLKQKIEQVRR